MEQHVRVGAGEGVSGATLTHTIDADRTTGSVQQAVASVAVTVGAKPVLSVADTEATEGDATLDFVVTLDPAATATVTVDYATLDGTATSGADYVAVSGTLRFDRGESEKTIEVPLTDDRVEDTGETLMLTLSNASGAEIADSEAEGTIRNTEGEPPTEPEEPEASSLTASFSEAIASKRAVVRSAFAVSGGSVSGLVRQGGSALWKIKIQPSGHGDLSIALPVGSVETADGDGLTNTPSAQVQGLAGIAVADARVHENTHAPLAFAVTLSRAASSTVTVDYATANGTATAGADYAATSGTLSFAAGETSKTISVAVLDDDHDEGEETLSLSNASGARISDASATGTIENTDPLPRGLMTRFGRAVAGQVVAHVEERLQAPREPGFRGRFAGRELRRGIEREMAVGFLSQFGGVSGGNPAGVGIGGVLRAVEI